METTAVLLHRIAQGDERAKSELANACLPVLRRFAHGRLPRSARGIVTTEDVVFAALQRSMKEIERFSLRHEGSFLSYARTAVVNEIIDQSRRAKSRPVGSEVDENVVALGTSPVGEAMGHEFMARYENALQRLTPEQREAFVLRMEFGYSHQKTADAIGAPSVDAARMLVRRAIERLKDELRDFEPED